jgi:hypothetical protein
MGGLFLPSLPYLPPARPWAWIQWPDNSLEQGETVPNIWDCDQGDRCQLISYHPATIW